MPQFRVEMKVGEDRSVEAFEFKIEGDWIVFKEAGQRTPVLTLKAADVWAISRPPADAE